MEVNMIKIVTDSGADLPADLIKELDITVVPVYIYFGDKAYKDLVEISPDELYKRLVEGPIYPTTTQPKPADFAEVYTKLAKDADAIISIHLSSKVSGTYNAAMQGVELAKPSCQVHVFDSSHVSAALGLIVLHAARLVKSGAKLADIIDEIKKAIGKTELRGNHHQAEKKDHGGGVHRGPDLARAQPPRGQKRDGAEKCHPRSVQRQSGNLSQDHSHVNDDKDSEHQAIQRFGAFPPSP
jgi:DegV family protein with EDD domain